VKLQDDSWTSLPPLVSVAPPEKSRVRHLWTGVFGSPQRWTDGALGTAYVLGAVSAVLILAAAMVIFRAVQPSADPALSQDFTASVDGPVSVADTGQLWIQSTNGSPDADLRVIDGALTNNAAGPGPAVGSISADLPQAVSRVAATFGFREGATDNGSAAIIVLVDPPLSNDGVTDLTSPCHVVITPTKIDYGVANNGRIANVGTATFAEKLTVGTGYNIDIEINYDKGIVRIDGPDGETRVYSDSRIATNRGSIVAYQVYQRTASTDYRSYFDDVRAW
jgi:hypothetical protein